MRPVTCWAVFEDCRRILPLEGRVEPLFSEALQREQEYARLGALHPADKTWLAATLVNVRERWPQPHMHPELDRRLAFCVASLIHAGCERVMRPLVHGLAASAAEAAEVSAYLEVASFRRVFLAGYEAEFESFLTAGGREDREEGLRGFIQALFLRALQSSHTLVPDLIRVEPWLDRLLERVRLLEESIARLARVYCRPDPHCLRRFRLDGEFYSAEDPAVRVAEALRGGGQEGGNEIAGAFRDGANHSHYGRALETALRYLRAAGEYWRVPDSPLMGHLLSVPKYTAGSAAWTDGWSRTGGSHGSK